MKEQKGILVVGEFEEGKLSSLTRELLGGARKLGDDSNEEIGLLLIGKDSATLANQGLSSGADKIYLADGAQFNKYCPELFISLISKLCTQIKPVMCLMGQTDFGRDVAPGVAARMGSGLCMDCSDMKFDAEKGSFVQTRPVYGGKALAVMNSAIGTMQINTIRAKAMEPLPLQEGRVGEIVTICDYGEPKTAGATRVALSELDKTGMRLEDAKVIVAGGGGMGGPEGFKLIKELADLLKGSVGATRVPVDEGYAPLSMEIGQTGKIVGPDIYIAVGISGAAQHVTGCLNSKTIISINKDPDASIFKMSDFGLVADYKVALPVLIEKLKSAGL
ncbi:MAG: electron transfer flavoprotein subunit alpha/FixB family protein [Smithellaceae bacterium]